MSTEQPSVPCIACSKCGTEHHIDATTLPEQGRCRNCSGFLRRPTEDEEQQFYDFLESQMEEKNDGT